MRRLVITLVAGLAAGGVAGAALVGTAGGTGGGGESARAAGGGSAITGLACRLRGTNEIGQTGRRGAGDRDGQGACSVLIVGTRVCHGIQVARIDRPVAAHIHRGRAGVNGAVVVTLRHPSSGNPGTSAACATASSSLAREIARNPTGFYVNVHTGAFPNGAIRGQLFRPTAAQDR